MRRLSEILKANGRNVIKTNIVNDRGIHICKSILAWRKWGHGETPENTKIAYRKKGDHLVGDYYVKFEHKSRNQLEKYLHNFLHAIASKNANYKYKKVLKKEPKEAAEEKKEEPKPEEEKAKEKEEKAPEPELVEAPAGLGFGFVAEKDVAQEAKPEPEKPAGNLGLRRACRGGVRYGRFHGSARSAVRRRGQQWRPSHP